MRWRNVLGLAVFGYGAGQLGVWLGLFTAFSRTHAGAPPSLYGREVLAGIAGIVVGLVLLVERHVKRRLLRHRARRLRAARVADLEEHDRRRADLEPEGGVE